MSGAVISSACCCVCPPQSCCCECLKVPTDITITGSVDWNSDLVENWCDSSSGTRQTANSQGIASLVGIGTITHFPTVGTPDKRTHTNSVPHNAPYSTGKIVGTMAISGSGSGSVARQTVIGEPTVFTREGSYTVSWSTVTGDILLESIAGNTTVYRWNVDNTNNSYNCDEDDCRLLVYSCISCSILMKQEWSATDRHIWRDSNGDLVSDDTYNTSDTTYFPLPINVIMQYPGEYRDCEQSLSTSNYKVVESSIETILQRIEFSPLTAELPMGGNSTVQDACGDGSISEQDRQLGIAERVYSDLESDPECISSIQAERNDTTNNKATIKHDIQEADLEGVICP